MNDSAIGSALVIPQSALEAIEQVDKKLIDIQTHAEQVAKGVPAAFATSANGISNFGTALDQIISKLNLIESATKNASGGLSNIGTDKATQGVIQMSGAVTKATEGIEKLAASQNKEANSNNLAKSIADWQELQKQIDNLNKRQQELTESTRKYEFELDRMRNGKSDVLTKEDRTNYASQTKELEENKQVIADLREKQQLIIKNNQALSQQVALVESIRKYGQDSTFNEMKYKAEMQQLKDAIQLRAKKASETQKQEEAEKKAAEKAAEKIAKEEEKKAKAAEKAAERSMKAWEKASRSTPAYGQQYHNERQAMYNDLFSAKNVTTSSALVGSQSATTLREHVAVIKELQQARLNLDTTDKNYKNNLIAVNNAIKEHSKVLREAGVNTSTLGEKTSYLTGYLSRLAQRTAVAFSFSAAKSFVEQIAEVRGQFEISERSLEAILQNKPKADEIFNKTVELAVKSPFRIKDLVDYTRQLSAYRIESDRLYDTTKRLADVSAGLGVDMSRLILAYGQVKAAAYLRGSEVRQFTEAGINIYGELQSYFKEIKGEAYTTAQIVDMISKRKVTFQDIEAIFQRMTDKGGLFYNMQEQQAETLQGKISNLKDSFDVMLNAIGKGSQGTFNSLIELANSLLRNWKEVGSILTQVISAFAAVKLKSMGVFDGISKAFNGMMTNVKSFMVGFTTTWNQFGAKAALGDTLTSLGRGIKYLFSSIKTALSGMAFMAVLQGIMDVYSSYKNYNKEVAEANRNYAEARGHLADLRNEYTNLVTETNKASDAQKRFTDKNADIEAKRNVLQKLIDTMNKEGFDIKLNVQELDEKQINDNFNKLTIAYNKFQQEILTVQKNISSNKAWSVITDDINEDAQDYTNAVLELLSKDQEIDEIINKVKSSYKDVTGAAKDYYNVIAAGRNEGESDLDYYTRMNDALSKLATLLHPQKSNLSKTLDAYKEDFTKLFGSVKDQASEFENELDDVMGYLKSKNYDKQTIKLIIDKTAAEQEWSTYAKEMAYKKFEIPIQIDKKSVVDEISWVTTYIADSLKNKKFGITVSVDNLNNTNAIDKFIEEGDTAAKTAKKWKTFIDRFSKGKGTDSINVEAALKDVLKGTLYATADKITRKELLSIARQRLKEATTYSKDIMGVNPFEKEDTKKSKENAKTQRDILQERINLLKDMNSKYNELTKTEGKEQALADTRKYFKEAAQNVGWSANDILPDDQSVIKRIRELGATVKEVAKRGGYFRIAADIETKIDEKKYNELKDSISRNIDNAFSQLDLYKKLKNSGLSDSLIKQMFGDITTSFNELGNTIDDEFNRYTTEAYEKRFGTDYKKWGSDVIDKYNKALSNTAQTMEEAGSDTAKSYLDTTKKLNEKIKQDTIDTFVELTNAYKEQLSEQLQLDTWYVGERNKIQNNTELQKDPELQRLYQDNLDKQYRQKSDANSWKDFQESDMYIRLFENLEQVSGKALTAMYSKLQSLRSSLKDLDPTQLKSIVDQMKKIDDVRSSRNPFKAFTSGLKDMIKAQKQLKALGGVDKYVQLNQQKDSQESMLSSLNMQTSELQEQYDLEVRLNGEESDRAKTLKTHLAISKSAVETLKKQVGLTDEQIQKLGTVMTNEENAKSKFSKSVSDITSIVSSMGQAFSGLMDSLGESNPQLTSAINFLDHAGQAVASYFSGNYAGVVMGAVGAIGDLVNLFTDESDIDEYLQRLEREISTLQRAYNNLKEAMDNAFDTQTLYNYNKAAKEQLEKQIVAYDRMIEAERSRKSPDKSKIQELQETKEDLEKSIKELSETMAEELGGFGSQANYKSAAEAFAEAWVDAFNEGSDALEALNDKFDEYFDNLLKKQLMQRASAKFIEPILKAFDDAVAEGSAGGSNGLEVTKEELDNIKALKDKNLAEFDDYAKTLMEILNVKPSGSSNLSNLQQGIQSVTEATAQALESILNSMRYYLATQQADVRVIRDTLLERLGMAVTSVTQDTSSSPVLIELRLQTTILTDIRDTLSSCVKGGHKQGRNGIKVFMN